MPEEVKEKEKEIYRNQAKESGKPEKILDKIAEGKLEKFFQEVCLLEQPFIKEPGRDHQEGCSRTRLQRWARTYW